MGRPIAENGYDRTTIRSIAAAAGSDPGLVMRYFGSKEKLFAQAATIPADGPITGSPEQIAELLARYR
ncbi:MAG TPA: helix-turn-helix domain-containing protein [Kribbella sp.]